MVKVSKLRSLDIYTNTGHYVGRVEDVVLNIRLGTISKLQVRAIEHERKPAGVINSFLGSIRGEVPEENDMKSFQDDVLTVDFDKVQAISDIMLEETKNHKFLMLLSQNNLKLNHKKNKSNLTLKELSFFHLFFLLTFF